MVYDNYFSEANLNPTLFRWLESMLDYIKKDFNFIPVNLCTTEIKGSLCISGSIRAVEEAIQNSNIHCPPRILPIKNTIPSSSVFLNSKPDIIINISTLKSKKNKKIQLIF